MTNASRVKLSGSLLLVLLNAVPCFAGGGTSSCAENALDFPFSGAIDDFVVPDGVSRVFATLRGAGGGLGHPANAGGYGAFVAASFDVTPGESLEIIVGGRGESAGSGTFCGGGGGGASVVARAGMVPILIAAGGGGGGGNGPAGPTANASLTPFANDGEGSDGGNGGSGGNGGGVGNAAGGGGLDSFGASIGGGPSGGAALVSGAAGGTAGINGADGGFGGGGASGADQIAPPERALGDSCAGGGGGGGYTGGGGGGLDDSSNGAGGGGGTWLAPGTNLEVPLSPAGTPEGTVGLCWRVDSVVEVPALDRPALAALALVLAAASVFVIRRR
jgi:hypothetical protein